MVKVCLLIFQWILCFLLSSYTLGLENFELRPKTRCIPTMGVAVLMDPIGFLPRLMKSIDFCVDDFVLVLSRNFSISSLDTFRLHPNIQRVHVMRSAHHLIGVSEGWNTILRSHPKSPWFLICGYDVEFLSGQLEAISFRFWNHSTSNPIHANFAHTRWQNLPGGKGYGLFALSAEVIQHIGLFDENIFPAFWEDRDWKMRLSLWSGARVKTYRLIRPWHGLHGDNKSVSVVRYISGTSYLPSSWRDLSSKAGGWNQRYVVEKWGCNLTHSIQRHDLLDCVYKTPFNNPAHGLSYWKKNKRRIQKLRELYKAAMNISD